MMENILIRTATERDIEAIYDIEIKSFNKPFTLENLRHEFRIAFSFFIVAELENRVEAYAIVWKVHDEIHLNKIAVSAEYRNRGVGRALVEYIINNVNPCYAKIILIEVKERDTGARNFYKKLNFAETGFRRDYYIDDNGREIGLIVPKNAVDAITLQPIKEDQTLVDFNHESAFDRYYTIDSFNRLLRMAGNNPLMAKSPSTGQPIDPTTIQPAKARRFFKKGGVVRK